MNKVKNISILFVLAISSFSPTIYITAHDDCIKAGDNCMCSNTGMIGSCQKGSIKSGLYCHCKKSVSV